MIPYPKNGFAAWRSPQHSGLQAFRPLLWAVAALALLATVMAAAMPTSDAQNDNRLRPVAIAQQVTDSDPDNDPTTVHFTAEDSLCFDSDGSAETCEFEWEISPSSSPYAWLSLTGADTDTVTISLPSEGVIERYGTEFALKVTVSDSDSPPNTDVCDGKNADKGGASVCDRDLVYKLDQKPEAVIKVSAMLPDPDKPDVSDHDDDGDGMTDEYDERYPLDGIINGPGENGNRDDEWDVAEGSLLVIDGTGSMDSEGGIMANCSWMSSINPSGALSDLPEPTSGSACTKGQSGLFTTDSDPDATDDSETLGQLQDDHRTAYLVVTLVVTDSDGGDGEDTARAIIRVHNRVDPPRVMLQPSIAEDDSDSVLNPAPGGPNGDGERWQVEAGSDINIQILDKKSAKDADGEYMALDASGSAYAIEWDEAEVDGSDESMAVLSVPDDTADGTTIRVTASVTDSMRESASAGLVFIVVDNVRPIANVVGDDGIVDGYPSIVVNDGLTGGDLDDNGRGTGWVNLRGIGFDPDGRISQYAWEELVLAGADNPELPAGNSNPPVEIMLPAKPVLSLARSGDGTLSVKVPDITDKHNTVMIDHDKDGDTDEVTALVVPLRFTVYDRWGVSSEDGRESILMLVIVDNTDAPARAEAGGDLTVEPGDFVRLNGARSASASSADAKNRTYMWEYVGIETSPKTEDRERISAGERSEGFVEGMWFPYDGKVDAADVKADDDLTLGANIPDDYDGDADEMQRGSYHPTAGGILKNHKTAYPYFDAPDLTLFTSVTLTFKLTVEVWNDDKTEVTSRDTDEVSVTVASQNFFSWHVEGPDFCLSMSLGGPRTYPFDSDGDGVADVCSLPYTRREAIARQSALDTMVTLFPDLFEQHLFGHDVEDDEDTDDVDESLESIPSQCDKAPDDLDGDTEAALEEDSCSLGVVSKAALVKSRDPQFYSGIIDDEFFCANRSLGGARTYPFDSDGDGVADVCSLPYTKREAIARQNAAIAAFVQPTEHPSWANALQASCRNLGTLVFDGDSEEDTAKDACSPDEQRKGDPLPTPTN